MPADTATISMSTAGASGLVIWFFQCLAAHTLIQPDDVVSGLIAGFSLPIVHALRDAIVARLDKGVN